MANKKLDQTRIIHSEQQVRLAAIRACELLEDAYANGEVNGGEMDWNDVDQARDQATHALALAKRFKAQGKTRRKPS